MSITLGVATKLLDDMMVNYSEWHTKRAPTGKKVNSVEETSSLSDKVDAIMNMNSSGHTVVDPNNRSEEHTSELQSHYSISYAVFCLKKREKWPCRSRHGWRCDAGQMGRAHV